MGDQDQQPIPPLRFFRARPELGTEFGIGLLCAGIGMVLVHFGWPLRRYLGVHWAVTSFLLSILACALAIVVAGVYRAVAVLFLLYRSRNPMILLAGQQMDWQAGRRRFTIDLRHVRRVEAIAADTEDGRRAVIRLHVRRGWKPHRRFGGKRTIDIDVRHGKQDAETLRVAVERARAGIAPDPASLAFIPNSLHPRRRLANLLLAVALLAYAGIGVWIDDLGVPTNAGDALFHLKGWSAGLAAAGLVMFSLDLVGQVLDHYDRRPNEAAYEAFSCTARILGWSLAMAGIAVHLFGEAR